MITPLPRRRISGSTALAVRSGPTVLTSSWARISSSAQSSRAPAMPEPAQLIKPSIFPASCKIRSTAAWTESRLVTSRVTGRTPPSAAGGLLAPPYTVAPRAASVRAISRPMPELAPVTKYT